MFSVLRNNKKGALELSMNAIVIIVLAFAMLGLGLVFTRTLLTQATGSASDVTSTAKEQILDSLRQSDNKISVQKDIKIAKGDSTLVGVGLKNTGDTASTYTVKVLGDASGKVDIEATKVTATWNPTKTLTPGESDVLTIRVASTKSATATTTIVPVAVYEGDNIYASQEFFVTVY